MNPTVPDSVFPPPAPYRSLAVVLGLVLVVAVSGSVILDCLGCASFFGDEAIYANVSRESLETGVWLPLHFGGALYLQKPPLKITLVTALFRLFGESEFIARLPDAVFGIATIALLYLFAARRYGVATGLLAAAVLLGAENYIVNHGVRDSTQDSLITLLAFILVWAWIGVRADGPRRRTWWWIAAIAVVAVGLCKNMLGVLFAAVIVAIEVVSAVAARRRTSSLLDGLRLLLAAVAAFTLYSILMVLVTGGLFARNLLDDVFVRASSGLDPIHLHGPEYYLSRLSMDFGWWLLLLVPALVVAVGPRGRGGDTTARFLFGWAALVVAGFSLSVSKLPWYVYPSYPAVSLLVAIGALHVMRSFRWRIHKVALILVLLLVTATHVVGVRRAVKADVDVIDAHRFVQRLATLERAQLVVDEMSIRPLGRLREWNRYYLRSVPGVTWLDRKIGRFKVDPDSCVFLVCSNPSAHPPSEGFPWRPIMRIRTHDPLAAPLWVLGTCDLDVPGTVGADEVFWDGLITANGFEGRDFRGWSVGDGPDPGAPALEMP